MNDWRQRLSEHARSKAFKSSIQRFYFLRHGQTEHNRQRICQGHTDVPLNATGRGQADLAAQVLAAYAPSSIRASDLMRVRQTAAPLAAQLGLDVSTDQRLRERSFGIFEDRPFEGQLWSFDDPSIEPIDRFVDRTLAGFQAALDREDVLIATHGGLRRVVMAAFDVDLADWTAHNAVPLRFTQTTGGWNVEALTPAGAWPANGDQPDDLVR